MPSTSCAAPDNVSAITTCFLDLTRYGSGTSNVAPDLLNGGLFRVPGAGGQDYSVAAPFVRIELEDRNPGGVYAPSSSSGNVQPVALGSFNRPVRLGDIPRVTVCDGGGSTGTNCVQYYEFLLNVNTPSGNGSGSGTVSLDEFKLYVMGRSDVQEITTGGDPGDADASPPANEPRRAARAPLRVQPSRRPGEIPLTGASLRYDMDTTAGGDASILLNYNGGNVDLQALVPVSNFAGVSADSLVYLHSRFDSTCPPPCSKAPDSNPGKIDFSGSAEWSIRTSSNGPGTTQVPIAPTVLLMGLGLVGLVTVRRGAGRARS